jgi:hypothetical protein
MPIGRALEARASHLENHSAHYFSYLIFKRLLTDAVIPGNLQHRRKGLNNSTALKLKSTKPANFGQLQQAQMPASFIYEVRVCSYQPLYSRIFI